ncbi:MAG: SCO family protein [Bacteroidales bacterium]|nr:SCO family protein [Bacteroidales bacterium]
MKKRFFYSILLVLFASYELINAQPPKFGNNEEIGLYEKLDSIIPDDIILIDQDSNQVNLKSLINKPTFINFVYYNCPGLCSPLLDGLAEVIDRANIELGKDYQIITISMNEDDRPSIGIQKKKNYVSTIKKKIDASQWIWLTGDLKNIHKITDAVGFKFKRDGDDFIHTAAIIAISPKGKITRYLHGTYFLPFDLKMAAVEAADEKSSPTINKLLKYCFSYDAKGKTYVMNFTKISGTLIMILVAIFFFTVVLKKKPITHNKQKQ